MIRVLVIIALLAACGADREPQRTPEPTLTLDQEVQQYVVTYGGSEGQFRVILTSACPELANLMEGAMGRMDTEVEGNPEWREALGYSNAINSRQLDMDC